MALPVLAEETGPAMLGAGAVITTSPYRGVGSTMMPLPFIAGEYKGFYLYGVEAGYRLFDHKPIKLSVIVSPRLMGYHSDDSDALNGMDDRLRSIDAGLRAELGLPIEGLSFNVRFLHDICSRYDGSEGNLSLDQAFDSKYVRLRFFGGIKVLSSQLTDYYYGVQSSEARPDRPAYTPGHAVNPFAGLMVVTGFSEKWLVVTRLGVDGLDPVIRKSPLVDHSYTLMGMLAVVRKF